MGSVLMLLHKTYGLGTKEISAPQATLMKLVVDGILKANLPWFFVILGMIIAAIVELLGIPSLPMAVGLYLPLSLSTPVMAGGLIRFVVEKTSSKEKLPAKREQGVLFGSGLIAGAALVGVLIAGVVYFADEAKFTDAEPKIIENKVKLLQVLPPEDQKTISLEKALTFGTEKNNIVCLKNKNLLVAEYKVKILPRHFRIKKEKYRYKLFVEKDAKVLLNNKECGYVIEGYVLQDEDEIKIGAYRFKMNMSKYKKTHSLDRPLKINLATITNQDGKYILSAPQKCQC